MDEKLFRPDIIVHERGNDKNNKAIIEIKKSKHSGLDLAKLNALTDKKGHYQYVLGASFCVYPDSDILWFS